MVRTLKDSFWSLIKCVTYRQEKDEKLLKFLVLLSWQALLLCPQKLFWFCRYAVASLGSIYLPLANSICFRFAQTRYDINPRSRSEHIECLRSKHHIERVSVYRKSASADLYRRVVSLRALRIRKRIFLFWHNLCFRDRVAKPFALADQDKNHFYLDDGICNIS